METQLHLLPVSDPPPYSKYWEQGVPVSLQRGSHYPVILSLLKVIQQRNKNSAPNLNRITPVHFPKMEIPHHQVSLILCLSIVMIPLQ